MPFSRSSAHGIHSSTVSSPEPMNHFTYSGQGVWSFCRCAHSGTPNALLSCPQANILADFLGLTLRYECYPNVVLHVEVSGSCALNCRRGYRLYRIGVGSQCCAGLFPALIVHGELVQPEAILTKVCFVRSEHGFTRIRNVTFGGAVCLHCRNFFEDGCHQLLYAFRRRAKTDGQCVVLLGTPGDACSNADAVGPSKILSQHVSKACLQRRRQSLDPGSFSLLPIFKWTREGNASLALRLDAFLHCFRDDALGWFRSDVAPCFLAAGRRQRTQIPFDRGPHGLQAHVANKYERVIAGICKTIFVKGERLFEVRFVERGDRRRALSGMILRDDAIKGVVERCGRSSVTIGKSSTVLSVEYFEELRIRTRLGKPHIDQLEH